MGTVIPAASPCLSYPPSRGVVPNKMRGGTLACAVQISIEPVWPMDSPDESATKALRSLSARDSEDRDMAYGLSIT